MTSQTSHILHFDADLVSLELAGGKGLNLARLARRGYQVPGGFILTTTAYHSFVAANQLDQSIAGALSSVQANYLAALQAASECIRGDFSRGTISTELVQAILAEYHALGTPPLAVRSSATAEDLPDLSFAGQQDTFLNIKGDTALLEAIIQCWSSLWTARAISYRMRNQISQNQVALAVVVQQMVQSQASGVLFTANPLTGLRSEAVIDATLGLGEALVSGQVDPDHYVVDTLSGKVLSKKLGAKTISVRGKEGSGVKTVQEDAASVQALPDEQILALSNLGEQVAVEYNFPQDIEWAWVEGEGIHLLQSRPVTSLFPLPIGLPVEPLKVMFSFAAVQGMLDPVTPLGRDALRTIFAMGAGLFNIRVTSETQTVLYTAGERLWVNFTSILSNTTGRRVIPYVLGMVEPSIRQAVKLIQDDPRLQPKHSGISFGARLKLAHFFLPLAANLFANMISPRKRRAHIINGGERILNLMNTRCAAISGNRWEKLAAQADLLPTIAADKLRHTFLLFVSGVASGMASWNFLSMLVRKPEKNQASGPSPALSDLVLQVTRGMPYNPTTEMDLALWETARTIRHDPPSFNIFQTSSASELSARYRAGDLPEKCMQVISKFLDRYGGRGFGEIDLGRLRWAEEPTHVFEMLGSFLQITNEALAPDVIFARSVDSANEAIGQLVHSVRKTRRGWLKAHLVRFFAGRARQLMGIRESPKFFAVRMMWLVQRELLKTGREFVRAGELDQPDDLFYLSFSELKAFAARENKDWRSLITSRRVAYHSELLRRQIPRLLLSDGRAFYEGMNETASDSNTITGSPVSPGSVEGTVRVVLDPRQAHLLPGEIMVCPGTDPSWTPLFLSAGGLVMEVGGMMTHGAVVAREYGIPAVVGVHQATTRLKTGQRIRLDGSSGTIVLVTETQP